MNKAAVEKFAVWARQKLIDDITYKAGTLGISENGIAEKLPQSTNDLQFFDIGTKKYAEVSGKEIKQRDALVNAIYKREESFKNYTDAFNNVVEEVAYTWFNRLIAIRFMEANDYLPSGVRVLSSENKAKNEPDFVTSPFDTDLEFTPYEQDRIIQLKDDNKSDELFRMLFIKQCNKLNEILPELFEKTDDYSELLLTISFTDKDGIVYRLTHDINEDDFNVEKEGQVEIIGWMYQYYISKKHEEVIDPLHGKTIKKSDIPAATQIFTTDWVVRYMVDNSLGRYWIERNPESKLAEKLAFFVTPKDGKIDYVDEKVYPADLTFFDPCMGSGHILVYAFDVLMEIYRECGYSDRDAALNIVQQNLFGLDIDKRAYQLAYFAVMMKARSYNRRALTQNVSNNLAYIEESNAVSKFTYAGLTTDEEQNKIGEYLVEAFRHAQEIGSLQTIEKKDYKAFAEYLMNLENSDIQIDLFSAGWLTTTKPLMLQLIKQAYIMSNKYAVVCTNPPYMNKLEGHLKKFVTDYYKPYSGDLFSVFIYRNFAYCKSGGYSAFMTPNVWMFIKTYENLRSYILNKKSIITLVQMAKGAFFKEATVDICAFVLKNAKETEKGLYFRLEDFKGGMEVQRQKVLEAIENNDCGYFYESDQSNFSKIPGSPIAYWVSNQVINSFSQYKNGAEYADFRHGMSTSDNNRFLRYWHEVAKHNIGFHALSKSDTNIKKWYVYLKGGVFRRWYGNYEYVVNWKNDGAEIKEISNIKYPYLKGNLDFVLGGQMYFFKPGYTWSSLTSGNFGMRKFESGCIFDAKGQCFFVANEAVGDYLLALYNSCVFNLYGKVLAPTIDFNSGVISKIPVIIVNSKIEQIEVNVQNNVKMSKKDWDSFETSWNFKRHPLL